MSLIAPVCVLLKEVRAGDLDLIVIVCASVVLFALVVMRMADLVRQQERSVTRERLLSSSGTALVSCTTREEMQQAGLGVVGRLLEGPGAAILCLTEDGDLSAVGLNDDADWPPRTLPRAGERGLLEFAADDASQGLILEQEMLIALELPEEWTSGLVLPLPVRAGVLVVLVLAQSKPSHRFESPWRHWPHNSRSRWRARA